MGAIITYLYEADDPYTVLAHAIVGFYRPSEVIRLLTDDEYLMALITKEVRGLDIGGVFLDCIIEDILGKKKRMDYMRKLDSLAQYYYDNLDKTRFRSEIRLALKEAGIDINQ